MLYRYNRETKEYIGAMAKMTDPLESAKAGKDVFVIPPYCTELAPEFKENLVPVFNETINSWEYLEDNRGKRAYDKKTGKEVIITELGSLPQTLTFERPVFIEDLRELKRAEIRSIYEEELERAIKIGKIICSVNNRVELNKKLDAFGEFETINLEQEDNFILVNEDEIREATKYLYLREMLLAQRKASLFKELLKCRGKNKIEEFIVDFNIEEDLKKLLKLSVEEINEYFKEV